MPTSPWTSPWALPCELLFLAGFLLLCVAVGRRVFQLLGAGPGTTQAERGVLALALGMGALQYVPLALGALHVLHPATLRWVMIGLAALIAWDTRETLALLRASFTPQVAWKVAWPVLVVLAPFLLVTALSALTPTIDADGLAYHLTVPKRWLAAGELEYLPTYTVSNTPLAGEMLFTIALVFAGDVAAKLTHFALGLAGAAALLLAGQRLRGTWTGVAAAALFLVGPLGVGGLLGKAYVEGTTAFAIIGATLAWLIWRDQRDAGSLRVAALLCGIALTFKLTAALFPIAMAAVTLYMLYAERAQRADARGPLRTVLGLSPYLVLPVTPWFVRSFLLTGNPVYPLFAKLIPSREQSPSVSSRYEQFNRYQNWASSMGPHWDLATRKAILVGVAVAFVVVGAIVFWRVRSRLARATTVVLVGTVLLQLGAAGLYVRYWIPILTVVQLALVALLPVYARAPEGALRQPSARKPWRVAGVAVLALLSLWQTRKVVSSDHNGDWAGLVRTGLGLGDRRTFLLEHLPLLPMYEAANRDLAADAHIMLSCTCAGYYVDRSTYCAEFPQDGLRSTTWPEFVSDLRRLRIEHVMAPQVLATNEPPPPLEYSSASILHREREYVLVRHLLSKHARLVATGADHGLYEFKLAELRDDEQL